jgi:hypothetical protein
MVLRSNEMLLSHFKRNRDAIPPHPVPPQALRLHSKNLEVFSGLYVVKKKRKNA